jgi:hypothetical protein
VKAQQPGVGPWARAKRLIPIVGDGVNGDLLHEDKLDLPEWTRTMVTVSADWLTKGYFVLRNDGLMCDVRDILEKSLRMARGSLDVRMYPEERKWKHTVWWRQGRPAYKEVQLFTQVSREYPLLSLGLAVEKGYPSMKVAKHAAKRMDSSWDWHHFVANAETILRSDIPALATRLQRPVTLRVTLPAVDSRSRAYSFAGGGWYERWEGHGTERRIVEHLNEVHGMDDQWAIVHLACDLSPADAHGLTARDLAKTLVGFNDIRKRIRGRVLPAR